MDSSCQLRLTGSEPFCVIFARAGHVLGNTDLTVYFSPAVLFVFRRLPTGVERAGDLVEVVADLAQVPARGE
ncbi:hypothetical protein [Streptomyces pinistramenti]|uniref:hypothetical protein n=1 Tax=Streptomyces pinistramenti TaxID=2884812 RepID=UPI002221D246|nr:hypothetical protein [Streptomyces pinistramenti]